MKSPMYQHPIHLLQRQTENQIVAVLDGTPLKQTEEGLKPIQSDFKVLPSGNVEVKGNDGKLKVLPKTGEEMNVFLSAAGGILSLVSGFIFFKKRQSMNNGYS